MERRGHPLRARWATTSPTTSPQDTDILAAFRITPQPGVPPRRRAPRSPGSPPPRPGPWCGPTGSPPTSTTRPSATRSIRRPAATASTSRYIAYDIDLFEEGSIPNLTSSIIGNVFGFKALQGAAPGGHAHPAALHQDVPGPAARHRHGTRVPGQVRPPAARRHDQAQARPVRPQLRPGGVRGAARRARFHQGRREHQFPAVHALARPVPVRHGGGQPRRRADRRDQGPLPERHRRHHGAHVRARRIRQRTRQRHRHGRPHRRLYRAAFDVELGPRQRRAPASAPGRPLHLHPAEDPRRQLPGHRQVVPAARRGPHPRRHRGRQARRRPQHHPRLLRHAAGSQRPGQTRPAASTSTRTGARCPASCRWPPAASTPARCTSCCTTWARTWSCSSAAARSATRWASRPAPPPTGSRSRP